VERLQALLPQAAALDDAAYDLRPEAVVHTAARILCLLTAAAAGAHAIHGSLVEALLQGWQLAEDEAGQLLRAALILCADHELNVSSFTARCVASAGSTPYQVVLAGMAALQGAHHGGHSARVAALLQEVGTPARARATLAARLRRGEAIPGFGHRLYPKGDPRAKLLLSLIAQSLPDSPALQLAEAVREAAAGLIGEYPNVDFGLATVARALRLPAGAPLTLFALGRTIGWLGHAIEQYKSGEMIRPRARYTGVAPETAQ
jgi:citrate synthase